MNESPKNKAPIKFPAFVWVFFGILALSLIVYVISLLSPAFSDFFNSYPAAAIRALLAWATYIFPFSIAEVLIILLPFFLIFLGILAYKKFCKTWRDAIVFTVSLAASVSLLFSSESAQELLPLPYRSLPVSYQYQYIPVQLHLRLHYGWQALLPCSWSFR